MKKYKDFITERSVVLKSNRKNSNDVLIDGVLVGDWMHDSSTDGWYFYAEDKYKESPDKKAFDSEKEMMDRIERIKV